MVRIEDESTNRVGHEPAVEELREKAEALQRIKDLQLQQKAKEELERGRSLERVFDIWPGSE